MGPHPYPWMVRELHRVIGDEAREQCRALTGGDPDVVVACVGGGSNAAGLFAGFVDTDGPARRRRAGRRRRRRARRARRRPRDAQLPHAGRARPGRGGALGVGRPRLPRRRTRALVPRGHRPGRVPAGRPTPRCSTRSACWPARRGSSCAFESAHAIAWVVREAPSLQGQTVLVCLSGRGDKDVAQAMDLIGAGGPGPPDDGPAWRSTSARRAPTAASCSCRTSPAATRAGRTPSAPPPRTAPTASRSASRSPIPVMDGPVIQQASQAALDAGITPPAVLDAAAEPRRRHPAGRDDVLQPRPPRRPRALRRAPRRRRHRRLHPARPPARGVRPVVRGGRRRRHRDGDARRADRARRPAAAGRRAVPRVRLRGRAARRDGRAGVTRRVGHRARRAAQGDHRPCPCSSASACPTPSRPARRARWPTVSCRARRSCAG